MTLKIFYFVNKTASSNQQMRCMLPTEFIFFQTFFMNEYLIFHQFTLYLQYEQSNTT